MQLIVLKFKAYMQAFGYKGVIDTRSSHSMPTKSAICGIIGSSLNYGRYSKEMVNLSRNIKIAVRADKKGSKEVDFHLINNIYQLGGKFKKNQYFNDGTSKIFKAVTYREYIFDAEFTIFINCEDVTLFENILNGIQDPYRPLFLGRKACITSRPVFEEVVDKYKDLKEAVECYPINYDSDFHQSNIGKIYYEVETLDGTNQLNDNIGNVTSHSYIYSTRLLNTGFIQNKLEENLNDFYKI